MANDAVVMRLDSERTAPFLSLKMHHEFNDGIANFFYYKYFVVTIAPIELVFEGTFCDEVIKFLNSIATSMQAAEDEARMLQDSLQLSERQPDDKKKQEPRGETKVFFEHFYIDTVRVIFSFNSSPLLFHNVDLNPTTKFLVAFLTNVKKIPLNFQAFMLQQQTMHVSTMATQMRKHYLRQCYSHQHIFKIISSLSLFGNMSQTFKSLGRAVSNLVYEPFADDNIFVGVVRGSATFLRHLIFAVSNALSQMLDTLMHGFSSLRYSTSASSQVEHQLGLDKRQSDPMLESHLEMIEYQNKNWLRMITKERQVYSEMKRRMMQTE